MYLVVGLGNPGLRYAQTRHNLGFSSLDHLARERGLTWRPQFGGLHAPASPSLVVLKPHTFMNRSGESVAAAARHFAIETSRVLVVHDEVDLPFGLLKLKFDGGEAGHRGLESISAALGTRGYGRLRLGIGRPPAEFVGTTAEFVLDSFAPVELAALPALLVSAVTAIEAVCERGFDAAMNDVNRRS